MHFTVFAVFAAAVVHAGHATYFEPNGNAGACGWDISNDVWAVALPPQAWDNGAHCGKGIKIKSNGKTLDGYIADLCAEGCASDQVDLTRGFFQQFSPLSAGKIVVDWSY
ncbi:Barwin-related endoglucanase [Cordyceps militaris CM01]|uniref:Barwin-related endoglucanase n=1 Tax=Cordyceps militaris (strain CM01) TaxID=983644 RepID=G3JMN4_CORMM|nr:Barwin-related endoglucanase [Cordyceps militaris CM01]EGX90070.1 Barwin-related endoglucanase [Cordyceps militaris CM01]